MKRLLRRREYRNTFQSPILTFAGNLQRAQRLATLTSLFGGTTKLLSSRMASRGLIGGESLTDRLSRRCSCSTIPRITRRSTLDVIDSLSEKAWRKLVCRQCVLVQQRFENREICQAQVTESNPCFGQIKRPGWLLTRTGLNIRLCCGRCIGRCLFWLPSCWRQRNPSFSR